MNPPLRSGFPLRGAKGAPLDSGLSQAFAASLGTWTLRVREIDVVNGFIDLLLMFLGPSDALANGIARRLRVAQAAGGRLSPAMMISTPQAREVAGPTDRGRRRIP